MNVDLLNKICAHILEEPRRHHMLAWVHSEEFELLQDRSAIHQEFPACGTIACIAGWALILASEIEAPELQRKICRDTNGFNVVVEAARILDIPVDMAPRLFHIEKWPFNYTSQLNSYPQGTLGYAQVTVDRIQHFIQTEGKE